MNTKSLKIYRFIPFLVRTLLKAQHEVVLEDGTKTIYRLVKGDSELDIRKQRKDAEEIRLEVVGYEMVVEDATTQKFLESRPDFGTNITLYDPIAENNKKLEANKKSINLLKEVLSFDKDKILQVGYVLFGRESLEDVKKGDVDGLQNKILAYGQENPEKLAEVVDDKANADTLFAGLLIATGIFVVSVDERKITWGDNGSLVISVPNGVSALQGLVEHFASEDGREVKKEAGMRLENKSKTNAVKKK